MNTSSNATAEFGAGSSKIAPAVLSATRPFYWSVRKELWEYRSIYLAPAAIAAVILLGFVFVLAGLPDTVHGVMAMDAAHQHDSISHPFEIVAGLIMAAAFIVSFYYALDTLYGERRDRSILFWKSLPVSDITTVLAKTFVLLVALPVISVAIMFVTEAIVVGLSMLVLAAHGLSVAAFLAQLQPIDSMNGMLYHIVTVHILWYAPMYCWLLLVSAWSKRAPLLWALLPPFAIVVFERVAFHTSYFQNFLDNRLSGGNGGHGMLDPEMRMHAFRFMITPGLWFGLLFAAAFLVIAARMRRYRGPI
jgi:ABC-2 type transport system permease protein